MCGLNIIIKHMKGYKQIKPQKQIRIPLQLTQKLDKISLIELKNTQTKFHNEALLTRGHFTTRINDYLDKFQTNNNRQARKFTTVSLQNKAGEFKPLAQQQKVAGLKDRSSSIRFRTTGAGFRQRSKNKEKEKQSEVKVQVKRVQSKIKIQFTKKVEQQIKQTSNFKDFIVEKADYVKREEKVQEKRKLLKRIHFGEIPHFREDPQFQYNDKFCLEDLGYEQQEQNFNSKGFGVNTNLSKFDIQSLADPNGERFLSQFKDKVGHCPLYVSDSYQWMQVRVLGFDASQNQAIIKRLAVGDTKKVSRLSIRFDQDPQSEKAYWQRITKAKRQRNSVKEQQKFQRYINSRKQEFPEINQGLLIAVHPKWKQIIRKDWLTYYSRVFIVYKEMYLKPQKFTSMGIKVRSYKRFKQLPIVAPYQQYQQCRQNLKLSHYSQFDKFPSTLYKLFDRLTVNACVALDLTLKSQTAEFILENQLKNLTETTNKLIKKVRQLLLSDIMGGLASSFKSKKESLRFYRLHNYIYQGLVMQNFYHFNVYAWLNYLQSFTSFTAQAPPPLLKITIELEVEQKRMFSIPSLEKIKEVLLKPLQVLQKQVQRIPDLLCEAKGGELTCLKIKRSLIVQASQKIESVVSYCYKPIANFLSKLEQKLDYLQSIKFNKQEFTQVGKKKYITQLQNINKDLIQVTHSLIFHSGLLQIDASPLKTSLESAILKQKSKLGKVIEKQIEEEIAEMVRQFMQKQQEIKKVPVDEWQLVGMREWLLGSCQQFLDYAIKHYQLCNQYFQVLENYFISYKNTIFQKNMQMVIIQLNLVKAINSKLTQLNELEQNMIDKINEERQAILRGLEEIAQKIQVIKGFSSLKTYSEHYVMVNRNYLLLEKYKQQLAHINKRETVLKQSISVFPHLEKLLRELKPYNQLWNIVFEFNTIMSSIQSDHIRTLNYEALRDKLQSFQKDTQNLLTLFTNIKNIAALGIVQILLERIIKAHQKLWIIRSFTLQGMIKKQGIRNQVLNTIFKEKEYKFSQLTLDTLQAQNVNYHKDFVIANSQKAERIWRLELRIADIVNEVKKLEFIISSRGGIAMVEEKELLSLSCAVHEQLQLIEAIKDLQESKYIQKKVNTIHQKFKVIEQTLLLMINFQQCFFPMKGLMKVDEILQQMGKEAATFAEVQKLWKTTCHHFSKDAQIWEAIDTDSYKNRIENGLKLMEEVEKTLNMVLDKKRTQFPRLFFIDRQDFKWLILNQDKINRSDFISLLFSGVSHIIFQPEDKIKGVMGVDGEQIIFKKLSDKKIIWHDLKIVAEQLTKIVQWQINITSNKHQKYGFGQAARILCQYTHFIEQGISQKNLKHVITKISEHLAQLKKQVSLKNFGLSSILLHFRDKVQTLIRKNVNELSNFQWRKQVKYYKTEGGGVQMRTVHLQLPFQTEYTANQMRFFALLSDKVAIQTIICAWHMNNGLIIQGKTIQTVKQLCGLTMRHFLTLSLSKDTNQDNLQCLLKGYLCSDVWLCLSILSTVTRQIFEMLSQISYEIHSTIESGRTLFYIGRQHFNLNKSFKFNLFIRPSQKPQEDGTFLSALQQHGHEKKGLKFGVVYRSASWITPPQCLVTKFILESMGMSAEFIETILKCYELSILKDVEQWYNSSFQNCLQQFVQKYIKSKQNNGELLKMFGQIWLSKFNYGRVQDFCSLFNKKEDIKQEEIFLQIFELIESKFLMKHILIVGPPLTGKRHFILNQLQKLQVNFTEPLQYSNTFIDQWILLQQTFYVETIPIQQKLVVRAKQTLRMNPGIINRFAVIYHQTPLSWKTVIQSKLAQFETSQQFKTELLRQLQIYFSTQSLQNSTKNSQAIGFVLSLFNFIQIYNKTVKFSTLNLMQRVQIVFMMIYWQSAAIYPQLKLNAADFGSSIQKDPINYYYDIHKSTWLEWVTLYEYHRDNTTVNVLSELFVPVRESISLIYFLSTTAYQGNLWIQSECSGIGLHRTIQRIISTGLLQIFRVHKETTFQGLSKVINYDVAIFKKEGKFYPKLGQHLTICIEDINMSIDSSFRNEVSNLINYSYDRNLKRLITNTTFICTNQDRLLKQSMNLNLAKTLVHLRAVGFSEESKKTIFNYYLQWFFGNTENPFSKDVRVATDLLIQLSIFIMNRLNEERCNVVSFSHLVRLFEGVCMASPRTVKSTSDIVELWFYEASNVLWDDRFRLQNNKNVLKKLIKQYLSQQSFYFDSILVQTLQRSLEAKDIMFIKKQSLKVQYSQTYRKVDMATIFNNFHQQIQRLNYKAFSNLPLIVYKDLFFFILKLTRIFLIPKRHMLFYGGRQSCQKIIVRLASFLQWGFDAPCVSFIQNWQKKLIQSLKELLKTSKAKAIVFKTSLNESHQFFTMIEEIVFLNHPRSFLLEKQLKYLQQIGLSSASSQQYSQFKKNIQNNLHCCITCPETSLQTIIQKYPALLRRIQSVNILQNYLINGLLQICQTSQGVISSKSSQIFQISQLLRSEGIEVSKQKWIKILQLMTYYYRQTQKKIEAQKMKIRQSCQKIRVTEHQKIQLEQELKQLKIRLEKIKAKVQQLWEDYKISDDQYQRMVVNYNEYNEQCEQERIKTNKIREEVDFELGKVLPLLKSAEEAMAKVTRDDINQLRSFPNPPVPAAKVVQSLVFLFNQSHLVKEKVLESGQKVRDFWQYAKKFILNDKLLKKVSEYNAQKIKSLDKSIIQTLRGMIKRPEFIEERVFKASSAAGNLSLWIKAIVAVYDVMTVIQPKKQMLNAAQEILMKKEANLKMLLDELNEFHANLMQKKKYYDLKVDQRERVYSKITKIEEYLHGAEQLLTMLYSKQKEWQRVVKVDLVNTLKSAQKESMVISIYLQVVVPIQQHKKEQITNKLKLKYDSIFKQLIYKQIFLEQYKQKFYHWLKKWENYQNPSIQSLTLTQNLVQGVVTLHQSLKLQKRIILCYDTSHLIQSYLQNSFTAEVFSLQIQVVDCLKLKTLKKKFKTQIQDQQHSERSQTEQKSNCSVTLIINIQHRPEFLSIFEQFVEKYKAQQMIVMVKQKTQQLVAMMKKRSLDFEVSIQKQQSLTQYLIKRAFNLPIMQVQELTHQNQHKILKDRFFQILLSEQNLITQEEALEQLLIINTKQLKMRTETIKYKHSSKMEEQKLNQIAAIYSKYSYVNLCLFSEILIRYTQNVDSQGDKSIWNFPDYLQQALQNINDSVVKIVQPQSSTLNSLAFYLLRYEGIQQLQKRQQTQNATSNQKEGIQKELASLKWQIVNPLSVLSALKRNQYAFVSLTNNYRLRRALEQCKIIEEKFKSEFIDEIVERQHFASIYLLSQCGNFDAKQRILLKNQTLNEVLTYEAGLQATNFVENYQMERFHRKFTQIMIKEREYFKVYLYNKSVVKETQEKYLLKAIEMKKESIQNRDQYRLGIKFSQKSNQGLEVGSKKILLIVQKGEEVANWDLIEQIYMKCIDN